MVPALEASPGTPEAAETYTLLVVEDDEVVREGMGLILQRAGYGATLAADGREALDLLQGGSPACLILLDMMMPVMDGWRFLDAKNRDPELASIPVIIMTAMGVASPQWASGLGAVSLFRKPIDVDALLQEIRRWCPPDGPVET